MGWLWLGCLYSVVVLFLHLFSSKWLSVHVLNRNNVWPHQCTCVKYASALCICRRLSWLQVTICLSRIRVKIIHAMRTTWHTLLNCLVQYRGPLLWWANTHRNFSQRGVSCVLWCMPSMNYEMCEYMCLLWIMMKLFCLLIRHMMNVYCILIVLLAWERVSGSVKLSVFPRTTGCMCLLPIDDCAFPVAAASVWNSLVSQSHYGHRQHCQFSTVDWRPS